MTRPALPLRAAIYARYSSENQREASIEDQMEVCRRLAEREGWRVVAAYDDRAMSGASAFRPGFATMLADAERGQFDVLVCESLDRLGRRLADMATLYDRLSFRRVALHTNSEGRISELHIGLGGMMAQKFLSDLRDKTWRGQLGRVRAGRIPGGLAFGYEVVPPPPGCTEGGARRVVEHQAEVVRRIFRDYAGGKSPRAIARAPNAEGIPGPGGRSWVDTTIRGHAERGTGILNNPIYIGRLVWNRTGFEKDPRTGKRVARLKDASLHEVMELPELRIVDDELWARVRGRHARHADEVTRTDTANPLRGAHRRRFLLSSLLKCGCCGGGYTVVGVDRYGCATRRGRGTCDNSLTISRQRIEARVLAGLKDRLLAPDMVAEALSALAAEAATARREARAAASGRRRELDDVERRLAGVIRAIEDGAWSEALKGRLADLESRKSHLQADLVAVERAEGPELRIHPGLIEQYRAQVARLEDALLDEAIRGEAEEAFRALVERVVLTPDEAAPDRLTAEVYGDLAVILRLGEERLVAGTGRRKAPGTHVLGALLSVDAGTRIGLCRTLLGSKEAQPSPSRR